MTKTRSLWLLMLAMLVSVVACLHVQVVQPPSPSPVPTQRQIVGTDVGNLNGDTVGPPWANTVTSLQHFPLSDAGPSAGQALLWDGGAWGPGSVSSGTSMLPPSSSQGGVDYNSIINGDIGSPKWEYEPSRVPSISLNAAAGPTGSLDAVDTNFTLTTSTNAILSSLFTVPSTVTSETISVPYALPSGASANNDVAVVVTDPSITTVYGSTCVLPSASWQTATLNLSLTAGNEYLLRLVANSSGFGCSTSGTQRVLWGRPQVTPTASSDSFWTTNFLRINLSARVWQDSPFAGGVGVGGGLVNSRYDYVGPNARFDFWTTATTFALDLADYADTTVQFVQIFVDRQPVQAVQGTSAGTYASRVVKVTGLRAGLKLVEIQTSAQLVFGTSLSSIFGVWPFGLYLPASEYNALAPPQSSSDTIVWTGTSKDSGFYATNATQQNVVQQLRQELESTSVVQLARGSQSLNWWYVLGGNSVIPYCQTILAAHPRIFVSGDYRNDWAGPSANSPWGGTSGADLTAWQNAEAQLLDCVHAGDQTIRIILKKDSHETSEGANNNGSTKANYETALSTIASNTNGSWLYPITILDQGTNWTSGQAATWTTDGIHPTGDGQGLEAQQGRLFFGR